LCGNEIQRLVQAVCKTSPLVIQERFGKFETSVYEKAFV